MKRMMWMAVTAMWLGCSGGESGEACDTEGDTRCTDDVAEACVDGAWVVDDDCAAEGYTCMQTDEMADGLAHCMPADMEM